MSGADHERVRDLLPDYARDGLGPVQASRVAAHVAECDECAAELAVLGDLRAAAVVPSERLAARVRDALDAARATGAPAAVPEIRLRTARPWRRRLWAPAAVLATVAVALVVTRSVGPGRGTDALDSAATLMARDSVVSAPYGDWPGADGTVAGLAMLDDLSEQQLQTLLERMER